ncbi:DNA repair protein RecO [Acinetobacter haemolyticus]|uniref:DNA repair protein RecO n=1 Tax=Acinetobacter haemolyticus TaxID=29430 RepID=A0AAJ2YPN0_ACIHA|nr:DNA repair protein RecO C-terminal domain-containing protein [Acinetobacter haemolyticus]AZN68519.1 DNA repair protein RecO [Acinetobacter haemolyticus]NAR51127.1 DNA repair protein RecO [Acinetobacter haemolyticus]NAR54821.1 DNA repair protein RecO [Acinetobacter haemolyticus]NAR61352.1 DNA repair protein RecO [Acinetobacter haemolyticus]NAR62257.1 DNA repair protein RecO [Acinetobacter haemolyticus]
MMRNEVLHGYLIHHRRYREKSHIVHLFTQEYGRVDGILRQIPPPQYQPIRLQATGKSELKNLTKLEILNQPVFFHGDAFFAGFYLNEIVLRLCPLEEAMPQTFQQYQLILLQLQLLATHEHALLFLRQILRQFEHVLLQELGYAIDFSIDANQQVIQHEQNYQFQLNDGFMPVAQASRSSMSGRLIATMQNYEQGQDFTHEQLQLLAKLYRQMISSLLGDRPLKSRQLWIQNTQT